MICCSHLNGLVGRRVGRKPILNEENCIKMATHLTTKAMNLDSVQASDGFRHTLQGFAKQDKPKSYGIVVISDRSKRRYKRLLQADVKVESKKNKSRSDGFINIRNSISFCAMIRQVQLEVSRELFCSSANVAVLLNGMTEKPRVISTPAAEKFLKSVNCTTSSTEQVEKQRVVKFNCTIAGDGRLTVSVIKFSAHGIATFQNKPLIFKLDDRLYVCLYHHGLADEIVERYVYEACIIKETVQRRNALIKQQQDGLQEVLLLQNAGIIESSSSPMDEAIILACDGACGQIKAIEDVLYSYCLQKRHNILWCNMQSSNNNGHCHSLLHSNFFPLNLSTIILRILLERIGKIYKELKKNFEWCILQVGVEVLQARQSVS